MTAARLAWYFALGAVVALPSLGWAEQLQFGVFGVTLHVRFLAYALASAVMGASAVLVFAHVRPPMWRPWLLIGAGFITWSVLAILLSPQSPREWLPPSLRWLLYLAAVAVAAGASRTLPNAGRTYVTAVGASLVVPVAAGVVELVTGSAPILNNAPRISGTLQGHPVAYSLVIASAALIVIAVLVKARLWIPLILLAVGAYLVVLFTFTRVVIVIVPAMAVATAVILAEGKRAMVRHAAAGAVVLVICGLVALPFISARFGDDPPMRVTHPASSPEAPSPSPGEGRSPDGVNGLAIDNSAVLRIETHVFGLEFLRQSPIVGHGPGSFDRLFEDATGRSNVAAHNDLLSAAVETGIVGLLLLVALHGTSLLAVLRAWRAGRLGHRASLAGVGAAFLLVNVLSVIHNPLYFPEVQLPLWLGVGLALTYGERVGEQP